MEKDLRALLEGAGGVTAPGGIDWGLRPQGKPLPAIALKTAHKPIAYTFRGRDDLTRSLVWIDCWGASYGSARSLADDVIEALHDAVSSEGPFLGLFVEDQPDHDEPGTGGIDSLLPDAARGARPSPAYPNNLKERLP